jgi:hypothetical protein
MLICNLYLLRSFQKHHPASSQPAKKQRRQDGQPRLGDWCPNGDQSVSDVMQQKEPV